MFTENSVIELTLLEKACKNEIKLIIKYFINKMLSKYQNYSCEWLASPKSTVQSFDFFLV